MQQALTYEFEQPHSFGSERLKIVLHDYAGHLAPAELARELAARGHTVVHAHFAGDTGPKGRVQRLASDPETLDFWSVGAEIEYSKTNFRQRRLGDIAYGKTLGRRVADFRPDVLISGNTPTEAQEEIVRRCRASGIPFIYWCQDFYSIAASRILAAKLPGPGHAIGAWYRYLERRQMRRSARVVHITDAFCDQTDRWGIARDRVSVIPNWGAIEEIPLQPRGNAWAAIQGLGDRPRLLYSGTLALKHNPELLAALARQVEDRATVVLVSNGVGAEALAARAVELRSLVCLPLQPFGVFPEVLGSADVLLAVIEREAGAYSVPSKILSYLCAGRPIVLAAPHDNLAAHILRETGAGKVVEPEDIAGFVAAALGYLSDPAAADAAGAAGRAYAEEHFVPARVADRFEELFLGSLPARHS